MAGIMKMPGVGRGVAFVMLASGAFHDVSQTHAATSNQEGLTEPLVGHVAVAIFFITIIGLAYYLMMPLLLRRRQEKRQNK